MKCDISEKVLAGQCDRRAIRKAKFCTGHGNDWLTLKVAKKCETAEKVLAKNYDISEKVLGEKCDDSVLWFH